MLQKQKNKKLMIIDGNALVHRSFHALPLTMVDKKGKTVNAVYGFVSFLIKAIRELKPQYIILTLDKKGPTFRHKKFKEYKAQRKKSPDELYKQIPKIKKLVQAFKIPIFELSGYEADDLIGTLTKKAQKYNLQNIIVTGDMDTLQLVDNNTQVYTMSRGITESIIYGKKEVKNRFKINPNQVIDYKALRGDPSDNIPGVRGIGEKMAVKLLKEFGTLDEIYKNLENQTKKLTDNFKPRIINLLKEYKKKAYLSRDLATIKCDVDLQFNLKEAIFGNYDKKEIIKFLSELEFKSLLPRVQILFNNNSNKENIPEDKFKRNQKKYKYILIDTKAKFNNFLTKLKKQKYFSFDTETSGLDPLLSKLLGISFSWRSGEAYYVLIKQEKEILPLEDRDNLFTPLNKKINKNKKDTINFYLENLKLVFENKEIKKNAHNAKFDIRVLKAAGIKVAGLFFDTMLASYLLNPGTRGHGLDALAFSEFGYEKISKTDLLRSGRNKINFAEVDIKKLSLYSCEDADFTNRLFKKLKPRLKEKKLDKLFFNIELPLVEVLAKIEDNGIKINKIFLEEMGQQMNKKIKIVEKKIYTQAGTQFNINSTQQLREIIFTKLNIPSLNIKKTKSGFSTAANELEKLHNLHSIIPLIQEYREMIKLENTYIRALPKLINKKTKRLHTSFNQTITATGRLSSANPNLQNIPVRTKAGKEIRKAFIAKKGFKLVSLDYSQIELRLAASMSGDKKMIKAFKNGADIHTATAAEINQVKPEAVSKEMRSEAKAVNFGILYGQGPHGLAQGADISYTRAKEFIDNYFFVYKSVKKFIEKEINKARRLGYTETLFGRRRYLPEINSSLAQIRKAAERMAINTPLQGTAADLIKIAMIKTDKYLSKLCSGRNNGKAKMLLQVHDELIFEIQNKASLEIAKKIKNIMENAIKLQVPIIVDMKIGNNWGEL